VVRAQNNKDVQFVVVVVVEILENNRQRAREEMEMEEFDGRLNAPPPPH
jgi:hypothetical protein